MVVSDIDEGADVLVWSGMEAIQDPEVFLPNSVSQLRNRSVWVRVTNLAGTELSLPQGLPIAQVERLLRCSVVSVASDLEDDIDDLYGLGQEGKLEESGQNDTTREEGERIRMGKVQEFCRDLTKSRDERIRKCTKQRLTSRPLMVSASPSDPLEPQQIRSAEHSGSDTRCGPVTHMGSSPCVL